MRSVGIKVLKNKLSEYVRLAERGETVLVTDRDRVVAELRPPQEVPPELAQYPGISDLIRRGVVTPRRVPPGTPLPPRKPVKGMTLKKLLKELDEDRRDR